MRRVLETEAWRKRIQDGEVFEHARFVDFITTKPLAGCGWPTDKVEALIKDDPQTLALWREAVTPAKHAHHDSDNITITPGRGTARSYTLSRLKREKPKLFQRVVSGELSANAAAIEAGFRRKLTPFEQVLKLIPKLNDSEKLELTMDLLASLPRLT